MKRLVFVILAGSSLAAAGCFGSTSQTNSGGDATGSDAVTSPDTLEADVGPDAGKPALPGSCSGDAECTVGHCRAGVCVPDPPTGLVATITDPDHDTPTTTPPNLTCLDAATGDVTVESPAGPATATLYGAVARFGSGLKSYNIQVDVFLAADFDPSECEAEPTDSKRAQCYQDYGDTRGPKPIGTSLSVPADAPAGSIPDRCQGHADCPLGYRCIEGDLDYTCEEQYGLYEIQNVPTNAMLVLRSRATELKSKWHDSYVFGVYLYADQVVDGRFHYDATIVSHGQWLLTSNMVGLPDVPETRGVVGGRVRDCRTDARDSWTVADASLALANPAKKMVFFNNLEDDTVPLDGRETTNILGRFAALDIAPGWNRIAVSVRVGEEVVAGGGMPVYVIPNALSIITLPGLQPHWQQH